MSEMEEDKWWKTQFERLKSTPEVWILQADSLIRAFDILAKAGEDGIREHLAQMQNEEETPLVYTPRIDSVALMQGGYAIEVLLKGLALTKPTVVKNMEEGDNAVSRTLLSHRLRELAKLAGVALTKEENFLCQRLEEFVFWAGRYPAPKNHAPLKPQPLPQKKGRAPLTASWSTDFQNIRNLLTKLRQMSGVPLPGTLMTNLLSDDA